MKPVIMTVDDDPQVLRSVERDLRSKYGNDFRVIQADSGLTALEILKQLKLRNEPPALFVVDQRMPNMTGVEFLERAHHFISFLTLSSNQIMSHVQFEMFCSEVLPYPYSEISK